MAFSAFDHECMALALRLAARGLYTCEPNPRVGCVITQAGQIIGKGWHHAAGGPHAEVAAISDAGQVSPGSTAYVTLEPCSHQGRTAPCVDALVDKQFSRVVVASLDPDPRVSGSGIKYLRDAGVAVETGLMQPAARSLNAGFMSRHEQGRPWIRVKSAISLDGRIALANGESQWISSDAARQDVQDWRARSSALMTGSGTVLADDPRLTARCTRPAKQPLRLVIDTNWKTPVRGRLFDSSTPVWIFGSEDHAVPGELQKIARCVPLKGNDRGIDLHAVMSYCAEHEINEIQVEAGGRLCGSLWESGLVDEWLVYQAPVLLGDNAQPPMSLGPLESMQERAHLELLESTRIGRDTRMLFRPISEERSCSPE